MRKHKILMLAFTVLAAALRAAGQCPTELVFDPSNPAHIDTSTIFPLDIKTNFCAKGNGIDNDQAALEAAKRFINARHGYCKLVIPAGVYRVGRQIHDTAGYYDYPVHVLDLADVRNVEISGQGGAIIKYVNGLRYGFFDPATGLPRNVAYTEYPQADTTRKYAAVVGDIIRVSNARNLSINNLVLDGNLYPGTMTIGGRDPNVSGFRGIQEDYAGINIFNVRGVTINKVTVQRFGLDGLTITDPLSATLPKTGRIFVSDFKSDYNGRQGASFMGADSVFFTRSSFTNSGLGEITYSGLQAGIDLEPNLGMILEHFFFDSCMFEGNRNTNIAISSGEGIVRDIHFTRCKSYNIGKNGKDIPGLSAGYNNSALDIGKHTDLNFTDCEFRGYTFISKNNATSAAEGYKFMRCLFSDCYQKMVKWTTQQGMFDIEHCARVRQQLNVISTPLVLAPGGTANNEWDYVTIDSSVFDIYLIRPWLSLPATYNKPSIIRNSSVYINSPSGPGSFIPETVAVSDMQLVTSNVKFFMYPNQSYVHDGVVVAGPASTTTSWGSDVFYRWQQPPYPNVCADTVLVSCPPGVLYNATAEQITYRSAAAARGYQLYPNPANANRFDLSNLDGTVLYFELLSANGRSIAQGSVVGYTTKNFSLPELSAGIYYLRMIQGNVVRVEKVVLQP